MNLYTIINTFNYCNTKENKLIIEFKVNKRIKIDLKYFSKIIIFILVFCFISILILFYFLKNRNKIVLENENIIDDPILPLTNEEYKVKKYNLSYFDSSHSRYNFHKIFDERKIFKINYSNLPYIKIDKSISYEENAGKIYNSTGMLNITKLDYYYNNIDIYTLNFNHIHLSMAFDNNYIELTSISIASILNVSSPDTYIHLHILCINFTFEDIKKIIQLKRINKNIEFIFYNSKQAEYDFGEKAKDNYRGVGEYARILAPEIINNTNKVLILDSGDIIAQKDISEIYFYDLGDNYFGWIIDPAAGNEYEYDIFFRNNFYPNTGVLLVNIRLFRKDNLYKESFFVYLAYKYFLLPIQDIFSLISIYKFKIIPLKYNSIIFFEYDEHINNKINQSIKIDNWLKNQKHSPYKYSIEDILEAAYDPVINHFFSGKVQEGIGVGCNRITYQWVQYAKLSGLYKEIRTKYPMPFYVCGNNLK